MIMYILIQPHQNIITIFEYWVKRDCSKQFDNQIKSCYGNMVTVKGL